MSDDPHFSEIDYFREAHPAHEPVSLADLANWAPAEESMLTEQPPAKDVQCALCHKWYAAEAQQLRGKWYFPNLCSPGCQGAAFDELMAKCEPAKIRSFGCPSCGIRKNIEPEWGGDVWVYFGQCSNCGTRWANATALIRKCANCGKRNAVTSRNPEGRCKCETPRSF